MISLIVTMIIGLYTLALLSFIVYLTALFVTVFVREIDKLIE